MILFGSIAFFSVLRPLKTSSDKTEDAARQNIRVDKIPINTEIKPDHYIYYILRPLNMSGDFKMHAYLTTSEDSFDFYIFDKKEDIRDSTAKPISTFLLMKNLNRTFPVEEGNVMVLANSRDKTVNILGMVEYTKS